MDFVYTSQIQACIRSRNRCGWHRWSGFVPYWTPTMSGDVLPQSLFLQLHIITAILHAITRTNTPIRIITKSAEQITIVILTIPDPMWTLKIYIHASEYLQVELLR